MRALFATIPPIPPPLLANSVSSVPSSWFNSQGIGIPGVGHGNGHGIFCTFQARNKLGDYSGSKKKLFRNGGSHNSDIWETIMKPL